MTPRQRLYLVLPLIILVVLLLTYLGAFSSPLVIAILVVLYFAVSLWNRRRVRRREESDS